MVKCIIFDMMGVIFKEADDTNNLLVPFVQQRNRHIKREKIVEAYLKASLGELTSDEFWREMNVCKIGEEKTVCSDYLHSCLEIDQDFINIANKLKDNYRLAILSNDVKEWSVQLRQMYKISHVIDDKDAIISGDARCRKPDMRIYHLLLNKICEKPEECVFIDDREKNLLPARELGIKVIKFSRNGNDEEDGVQDIPYVAGFADIEQLIKKI